MQPLSHTRANYFPLAKHSPGYAVLQDGKGAEGANINFILCTNHSFIWLHLFDNAHTVAYIVIFWAE